MYCDFYPDWKSYVDDWAVANSGATVWGETVGSSDLGYKSSSSSGSTVDHNKWHGSTYSGTYYGKAYHIYRLVDITGKVRI